MSKSLVEIFSTHPHHVIVRLSGDYPIVVTDPIENMDEAIRGATQRQLFARRIGSKSRYIVRKVEIGDKYWRRKVDRGGLVDIPEVHGGTDGTHGSAE